ncbi:MAG: NAD(P)/FAD-dependent oxidoreductase [Bacteroidota bacterium]
MHPLNIIGGGLAGSLMAVFLAQKGFRVNVYERRPDMRLDSKEGGRSINLALSARGMKALEETGLLPEMMEIAIPMYGRMMHATDGALTFQAYSRDEKTCIYSISRAELNRRLMDRSEALSLVDFHFEHICEGVDLKDGAIRLKDLHTGRAYEAPGKISMACDGAFSAVRYHLQRTPRFNLTQSFLSHGYKELTIPPSESGEFQLEPHALHIWPRGDFMMIALPNTDRSFTCTLFLAYEGAESFAALQTAEEVQHFFQTHFGDAVPLMPELLDDFFNNPTGDLVTIRCAPWVYGDRVALMGDASHAIVPFFGQGMNAAFEDCTVMNDCVEEFGTDWEQVFEAFQERRVPQANAIADMALENFIEMRDTVADPQFLFRKAIEHHLGRHIPRFQSRYEWVSFSTIPYAQAYRLGEINQQIIQELSAGISSVEELDLAHAQQLVDHYYDQEAGI